MPPWDDIAPGTLADWGIEQLAAAGELITREFHLDSVKQACYELRASDTFWDVAATAENKRVISNDGFLLGPKRSVVCISKESLRLPADVLGRVLTKGQLFSIGVLPVNTYVDPGFEGRLGLTLWNASNRYILITPDQPIAKIEFERLPRAVQRPYAGQHGYETDIWPIPVHLYADLSIPGIRAQIADTPSELDRSYGEQIGDLARGLDRYTRKVWLQLGLVIALFAIVFALHGQLSLFYSVLLGVVANLATFVVAPVISNGGGVPFLRRRSR